MLYKNHTSTSIELIEGDIRDAQETRILIGRNPELKAHFEKRVGCRFKPPSSWLSHFPVQQASNDESLSVLRTTIRPKGSTSQRHRQIRRLREGVQLPVLHSMPGAQEIAMTPISCRRHDVVATAMVQMMWDISIASFLNIKFWTETAKPEKFKIYCTASLQPFVDVLETGHYASVNHGWLFNTAIQCDPRKRLRYLKRNRFKFFADDAA